LTSDVKITLLSPFSATTDYSHMMKRSYTFAFSLVAAAIGMTASTLAPFNMASAHAQTPAAAADTLSPEIFKLAKPLQELLATKKYAEAQLILTQIDAIQKKTPFEAYYAETLRASIAQATGDKLGTIKAYASLVESGRLAPVDLIKTIQQLGIRNYEEKNYPEAISWLTRFLKEAGEDRQVRLLMIQALYLNNDFSRTATELRTLIETDEKAGIKPTQQILQLFASAIVQLKDKVAYIEVLEKFATYHPKKEYWADLLHRAEAQPGFAERLILDTYRLQFAADSMISASDYVEMAELAIAAGFPGEARKVLEHGYAAGLMGVGTPAEIKAHQKLRDQANKLAADDLKTIANGEADASKPGKDGNALANLGYALVQIGQFEKGLALIERGITRGLGKRMEDGKLHHAIALVMAGRKDDALKVFATVGGTEGAATLARYWLLHLNYAAK
jgi:hypothetical protein